MIHHDVFSVRNWTMAPGKSFDTIHIWESIEKKFHLHDKVEWSFQCWVAMCCYGECWLFHNLIGRHFVAGAIHNSQEGLKLCKSRVLYCRKHFIGTYNSRNNNSISKYHQKYPASKYRKYKKYYRRYAITILDWQCYYRETILLHHQVAPCNTHAMFSLSVW